MARLQNSDARSTDDIITKLVNPTTEQAIDDIPVDSTALSRMTGPNNYWF